jgi:3-methyladenine DNA glycosylase AlkD
MSKHVATAREAQQRLRSVGSPEVAAVSARFFKTGPGEYGEGDVFIGVRVPVIRKLAGQFKTLPLSQVEIILHSAIHEERLLALVVMTLQFEKGDAAGRKRIYDLYLGNTQHINNWDLVDLSAPNIVGAYLESRSRRPLYRLAKSSSLWQRRIAILATFHFIRRDDFKDTLKIAEMLLPDTEDLIHKAVGWMLREVGKRNMTVEEGFLKDHAGRMPRTMLRYAIERFPERKRRAYLSVAGPTRKG